MSDLAQQIADRLLTNGFGEKGDRLAIRAGFGKWPERDLGGWCRNSLIDQIQPLIEDETKRLREALDRADHALKLSGHHKSSDAREDIARTLASAEQQNTNKE